MSESVGSEVVSAMLGGVFSASALYPLEVLKTRMQAETKGGTSSSSKTGKEEEEKEDETSCPANEQEGIEAKDDDTQTTTTTNNNATTSSSTTSTSEQSKNQQHLKAKYSKAATEGMTSYASLMYENEGGVAPFYAGVVTSAVQSATEKSLYFFAYTFLKNGYVSLTGNSNIGALSNLILGCFAEWAHLPVTLPIDCLNTAIQTDDKNRGAFVLLGSILSEKGIGGFYKGIEAYTVLCLKPAIQYTVYEQVKKVVLAARLVTNNAQGRTSKTQVEDSLTAAEAFFLGMFARVIATMLTYPYLRAKVMLQSTYGNAKVKPTIPQMIGEQFSEGGVWGLYQGIGPELTRGVFSAALMMMVKERIGVVVRGMIDGNNTSRIEAQQLQRRDGK
mmetsp:Transcript_343/g.687  ORF Transcript_343/g.687 Transcript_343/m.687 type:complete len:389 (+) Transcript_343:251-1417(+)|eukprot:CAMPEP_0201871064 /NCGR_PEP_ID=MMETSP0902-20130614/4064_1 /ASSEMBLY_ACC=CAM_ASM_000551 /TAXON_ID=420261 /ORGANISM="Thalassiosira antarctica, Strain CCMP982" /LENGTH=388 /DNA_ID=CAMNT_0048396929 /DNA_START=144 /DNA_END=1310 /DNA_ORIENTATION=+